MRAEILSIGTELLLGQITDTNAVYLSQQLAELGIPLFFRDTVGDNHERLRDTLRLAKSRAELIICTGGLGPTQDDITAEDIAAVFEAPLELRDDARRDMEEFFRARNREVTEKQLKQAYLPQGAIMLPNPNGTAPGFILEKDGVAVVAMPGPPNEMEPMWRDGVTPFLRARSGYTIVSRTLRFCGVGEAALETLLEDIINAQVNPTVAPYAKIAECHIRVTARAASEEAAAALIAPVEAAIRARAGQFIYGIDDQPLEEVVGLLLRERGLTLAVAESCTGGGLGARLTNIAGSSDYFLGGVIAYSNALKMKLLGVPEAMLIAHGAVSEPTASAMAAGVVAATGADIGVSITGVAGPGGGTAEKPVGLIYIGIARRGEAPRAYRYTMYGNRVSVRLRAAQEALVALHHTLTGQEVKPW